MPREKKMYITNDLSTNLIVIIKKQRLLKILKTS
jgi:hypothetical protein